MNEERCPYCQSENFITDDYEEDYAEQDGITLYWKCKCNNCGKEFHIQEWYKLQRKTISTAEQWEEE